MWATGEGEPVDTLLVAIEWSFRHENGFLYPTLLADLIIAGVAAGGTWIWWRVTGRHRR